MATRYTTPPAECPACTAAISQTLLGHQRGRRCPYCNAEVGA